MHDGDRAALDAFVMHMRIANRSPETIGKRLDVLRRFRNHLKDKPLLDATPEDLGDYQASFAHLAPASVSIYSRHLQSFYRWTHQTGRTSTDPSAELTVPHIRKGKPHPIPGDDLRTVFALTRGQLRIPYMLAAFAGLRCAEICRLRTEALILVGQSPSARVIGKGRRERDVPLLPPVVAELRAAGLPRRGWIATLPNGLPFTPNRLSVESHQHLKELGVESTLHSMRHYFATFVAEVTHDPLLVRDLLGHESVATSEIYMATTVVDAHARLSGLSDAASTLLRPALRVVR
jgi:integrase/recombinase XerC